MEKILTVAITPETAKHLQVTLRDKNLSDGNKFAQLCKQVPELVVEANRLDQEMLNLLDPGDPMLAGWWQDELAKKKRIASRCIDKVRQERNELNLELRFEIAPEFFPYLRLKELIFRLQEKRPKASPEKLSEVIDKKEKKRRNKGYLGEIKTKGSLQALKEGHIPQRLKKLYEREKGHFPGWDSVKTMTGGGWLLKGKEATSILEFHDNLLVFDRELKADDSQKMLKLTGEIDERRERLQRSREKSSKLKQAYDMLARNASIDMSENELTEISEKMDKILGSDNLPLPKLPQTGKWQIHLILKEPPEEKLTRKTWLPISVILLIAFIVICAQLFFTGEAKEKPKFLPSGEQVTPPQNSVVAEILEQGDHYFERGRYRQAIESYDRALELDPSMAKVYVKRGKAYSMRHQYEEAVDDYTTALHFDSQMAQACFNRGNVYFGQGWYDEAIEDFNHALDLNPKSAQVYFSRGAVHSRQKQYEQAINDYTNALSLDPKLSRACFNRGNVYFDQGRYHEALEDLDRAIELNPKLADAYVIRGTIYSVQSRYDKSVEDYNHALELNPRLLQAYVNRGTDYSKQRRYDLAIEDYNRALKLNPDLVRALVNRGLAYIKQGDYQLAIDDFDHALDIGPKSATLYLDRGKAYLYKGSPEKAAVDFNSALAMEPNREEAFVHLGLAQYQQKRYRDALGNFERAIELNPALSGRLQSYIELAKQAEKKENN